MNGSGFIRVSAFSKSTLGENGSGKATTALFLGLGFSCQETEVRIPESGTLKSETLEILKRVVA